ncbi:hypothetical protein [Candidatus Poriferisocius sp.]|uniref:hypothetical protein n=1 Tax=Candidatus Poriferisocius sp. TaxID=3101276 RepID=UPI003B024887
MPGQEAGHSHFGFLGLVLGANRGRLGLAVFLMHGSDQDFWRSAHIVADSGAVAWGDGTEVDAYPLSLHLDITGQTFDELSSSENLLSNR